ncbi:hypothetical protein PO185_02650 [Limosilactobacillus mucosae]|jgi:hypothetical protein|uniref:hypothetical protein n=1 Tax=Limosilactobacillus mucosae TaxID=97478 RepID=UPI00233F01FF|nr:hypothetical protein [Limosilactobacillus mucosae]MDC2840553.1 hypothetical protein [Limosilactobacillus mucosae]MDC2844573.1 hypothetical protein [Limosilactobacillus mucosae]
MGSGYRGYSHTQGAIERFKPHDLMEELKNSGVKYTEKDVVLVAKNYNGKLLWLEKGNESSGLKHIEKRHQKDFGANTNVKDLLMKILPLKPLKHFSRKKGKKLADIYLYKKNSKLYLVAYGDNGYIVSFYPYGKG